MRLAVILVLLTGCGQRPGIYAPDPHSGVMLAKR